MRFNSHKHKGNDRRMLRVRQRNSRLVSRLVESKCPIGQIPNCEEKKNLWNSKKAARFGLNRTARGRSGPRRARAGLEPVLSKSGVDSGSGGTNNQSKETSTMNKRKSSGPDRHPRATSACRGSAPQRPSRNRPAGSASASEQECFI